MASSSQAGLKVNEASLAAATKIDILAAVSASGSSVGKRKSKSKYCDFNDRPHDKWRKFESEEDVSFVP